MSIGTNTQRMRNIANGTPMYKAYAYVRYLDKNYLSRAIMNCLEKGNPSVTEMHVMFRTEYLADISQVLARLRQIGIVSYEKSGKERYYFIVKERWNQVKSAIKELAQ